MSMRLFYFPGNTAESRGAARERWKSRKRPTLWAVMMPVLTEPTGR